MKGGQKREEDRIRHSRGGSENYGNTVEIHSEKEESTLESYINERLKPV